jgi:membrane protein required for colicin V production
MTVVDWIIVCVLAGSVLTGLAQGFLRSAFSLGGLFLGLVLAAWNYGHIATMLHSVVHSWGVANTIGFLLIAIVVAALMTGIGAALSDITHKIGLGCLDRLAGGVFGFFQGALFVTVCILVTVAFFPSATWLTESRLPHHFFAACHLSTHITPEGLTKLVREDLDHLERESPGWMHPGEHAR